MPSGKPRDLEDTWKVEELEKSIKDAKKSRSKDKDRDERKKDRRKEDDDDKKSRRKRDDDNEKKERRHKDRENGNVDKRKDRDRDKDKEKRRSKKEDEDEEERRRRKEKERRKRKEEEGDSKEKRRRHKEDDEVDERKERRHHGDEEDEERRRRRKEEKRREKEGDDDKERRRKHREEDGEKEKRRKHRDEDDGERKHRKHRDKDEDEDEKKERRRKDKEERRHHRDNEDEDERERWHRERKERKEREKGQDEEDERERRHRERKERKEREKAQEDEEEREKRHRERKERKEREQREREEEVAGSELGSKHSSYYRTFEEDMPTSQPERRKKQEKEKEKQEDDDYNYDDEDFEDYDDDFEDEEDDNSDEVEDEEPEDDFRGKQSKSEVDDLMRAMDEENERLMTESRRSKNRDRYEDSDSSDRTPKRDAPSRGRTFINFVSAKQRQVSNRAANKTRKRQNELQELIELDVAGYAMFDMPPVKEYDMYIKSFGRSNTRQAYVQTNDDNIEREIQTDEIETREKWCQHPPESFRGSGGGNQDEDDEEIITKQNDAIRLGKFLEQAGQAIAILLEEDRNEKIQGEINRKESNIIISEAFVELSPVSFLRKRHVIYSAFSPVQTHLLLTVYSKPEKASKSDKLSTKGIICVWNVNEPFRPQKILVSESQPTCCCFSPTKATLAFAGMHDGSIVVWDLRESSSLHHTYNSGKEEWLLRYPTYNTAGVLHYDNHQSAITTVVPVASPGESSTGASEGDGGDTESGAEISFQLATVEENSVLNLWVVAEISNPDLAGSESDLGLAPGGRVKLLKSSSIELENPTRNLRVKVSMTAYEMQLLPSDPSHFYIGTDTGCVIHGVRYGGKAPPKAFRPEIDSMVEVTSLDFSPFTEPVFLAGCGDGSLRLFHTQCENPLITWPSSTEGRSIKLVRWCRSRPNAFFVLDEESNLYIWDLNMGDAVPMKEEKVSNESIITSLCLSNDHNATGIGSPGRSPQMVVCLENGTVEVHTISKQFSALMPEEVDQFAAFINAIG